MPKSKKRSDAKSRSQPEFPTIFRDRNLGRYIISDALRANGISVEVHDDHLAPDVPDETWIKLVGSEKWLGITWDRYIRNRVAEIDAVRRHRARIIVPRMKNAKGEEMAEVLVRSIHRIARFTANTTAPFMARIYKSGKIEKYDI